MRWETECVVLNILTSRPQGSGAAVLRRGLGVWTQAPSFSESDLRDPIDAVVLRPEGIRASVPLPERHAVHGPIIASARAGLHQAKLEKDLMQAAAFVHVPAGARPFELATARRDAISRGPEPSRAIEASPGARTSRTC